MKQGDSVSVGHEISVTTLAPPKVTETYTKIFAKDGQPDEPVQYMDMTDIERVGKVTIPIEKSSDETKLEKETIYTFGNTEIHVRSVHLASGKETTGTFGFLSDPSAD